MASHEEKEAHATIGQIQTEDSNVSFENESVGLKEYFPDDIDKLVKPFNVDTELFSLKKLFKRDKVPRDKNSIATRLSVYEDPDPKVAKKYYPPPKYENFTRFDPYFRWTVGEERKAVLKVDLKILTVVSLMFFALDLDRGNLSQAIAGGFLEDTNISNDDYNLGNTLQVIAFILGEIPSQLLGKRFGPDKWIPIQIVLWLILAGGQFWINSRNSFLAIRFLLGAFQSGFIADAVAYINMFYTREELSTRLAIFWLTNNYASIVSSLLAIGFLKIDLYGVRPWSWLFLFDAIVSLTVGIAAYFLMVPGPSQTRKKWLKQGYLTEREEKIIVNRLLRDDPTKSDMSNREGISFRQFLKTLTDFDLWPLYIVSFFFDIGVYPTKAYQSINLKRLGFSTTVINVLNIPIQAFGAFTFLLWAFLSDYFNERGIIGFFSQIWMLIFIVIEYTCAHKLSPWAQYVMMFFIIGFPNPQPIVVSWCCSVAYSVRARTIASPISNIGVQLASILGANLYRSDDAPYYERGNRNLIGIVSTGAFFFLFTKVYYIFRNRQKTKKWNVLLAEEKLAYLEKHRLDGNKRIDFLFPH